MPFFLNERRGARGGDVAYFAEIASAVIFAKISPFPLYYDDGPASDFMSFLMLAFPLLEFLKSFTNIINPV